MKRAFVDYYRCPEEFVDFRLATAGASEPEFFLFGAETLCYGELSKRVRPALRSGSFVDAAKDVRIEGETCYLPFDPTLVVNNLRLERYVNGFNKDLASKGFVRDLYYFLRPIMPLSIRMHLQKKHFRGWESIRHPKWPLDRTVEQILQRLLGFAMKARGITRMPFVWFWPEGFAGCAIVTHDVETSAGRDFCSTLMDIDDSFKIKSSFQIVPEERYSVSSQFLNDIRNRGFETNIHDLNHDGRLFTNPEQFLRRAERINHYAKEFKAKGFRSGQLYRNQQWFDGLEFSYDMSVPNVAHLDPQRGGCCTVMPYFIGKLVELPLTTTQDYQYFNILGKHTIDLWKEQTDLILESHGLASFLVHPDYILQKREQDTYRELLAYISHLREEGKIWLPLPREVDTWWRQRSEMTLSQDGDSWKVTGPGSERARLAYASLVGDKVVYTVDQHEK